MEKTEHSVIEYLGENDDGTCGYCKQKGGSKSYGFWAHVLSIQDYQLLINRNWRRSGQYCYIPKNSSTCCPMYTIKNDAMSFKLSRSHKKILKRMNKFLRDGTKDKERSHGRFQPSSHDEPKPSREHTNVDMQDISVVTQIEGESSGLMLNPTNQPKKKENVEPDLPASSVINAEKKRNPKKAKQIRIERKIAKLAAKGLTLADIPPKKRRNAEKSLEDFLNEEPVDGKHRLEVKIVPSTEATNQETFGLYKKYQMKIHNDTPEKLNVRSFERFLVNSPMKTKIIKSGHAENSDIKNTYDLFCNYETTIHKSEENELDSFISFLIKSPLEFTKNNETPTQGYGSFHYQYFLDGVLIAVGVIDILPQCVSSVYFYYDPKYSFLSLGTYASLREIALVREINKECPSVSNYYLGFYIPTCPKMRYKANVKPSFLLCPEVFTFHLLDEKLFKAVDAIRYMRINTDGEDEDKFRTNDLANMLMLANRKAIRYGDFACLYKKETIHKEKIEKFKEYGSVVGRTLSKRMLLFMM